MRHWLFYFFLVTATATSPLTSTNSTNISTGGNGNQCAEHHSGLLANGPCQSTLIYCKEGHPLNLNCPPTFIYNPTSKFCEKPADFIKPLPPIQQLVVVEPLPQQFPTSDLNNGQLASVFVQPLPPQPIHTMPFVGQASTYSNGFEDAAGAFSVLVPPAPQIEQYSPHSDGSFAQEPSVFYGEHPLEDEEKYQMPYVGHYEHSDDEQQQPSFSVMAPPAPHVEMFTDDSEGLFEDEHFNIVPSVFYPEPRPSAHQNYPKPFVGEYEEDEPAAQQQHEYLPNKEASNPKEEHTTDEEVNVFDAFLNEPQKSSKSKEDDENEQLESLIDDFKRGHPRKTGSGEVFEHPSEEQFVEHSNEQMRPREKPKHGHPIPMEPEHDHPTEVIDDQFIFGASSSDKYGEDGSAGQTPLVDSFHSPHNYQYAPKISAFAPLDSPADSGHDSFKQTPKSEPVESGFAAMNSPVELGHDIFNQFGHKQHEHSAGQGYHRRTKRSTSTLVQPQPPASTPAEDGMAMCRQLFAEQLASHPIQNKSTTGSNGQPHVSCVRNEVPSGCRQFYIACVDGRRVRRECPRGLFLDPLKESCKEREHIATCQTSQPPVVFVQAANEARNAQQAPRRASIPTRPLPPHVSVSAATTQAPVNRQNNNSFTQATTPTTTLGNQVGFDSPMGTVPSSSSTIPPTVKPNYMPSNASSAPLSASVGTTSGRNQPHSSERQSRRRQPSLPTYAHFSPDQFCSELPDGFYRHPKNCSRIIQCFGHELFEYPPCQHNLAFNQHKGVCDYRENVPGCSEQLDGNHRGSGSPPVEAFPLPTDEGEHQQENDIPSSTFKDNSTSDSFTASASTGSDIGACARGHSHGDHIEHPQHCSAFFRCVWGRLVPMSCPQGTAFNPRLSVCDYPGQVPSCQSA